MQEYLRNTEVIDWEHPDVFGQAKRLESGSTGALETAKRCFEWVRDNIQHSSDFRRGPVTCSASEVLKAGTGYCYAKSHLLAALLRANGIPAGFCYQRLSLDDTGAPYCLHGFNVVHLAGFGWYRVDPRGNKPGIDAQFHPPVEQLACKVNLPEEREFGEILPDPLDVVVSALRKYSQWDELGENLPDWEHPALPGAKLRTSTA